MCSKLFETLSFVALVVLYVSLCLFVYRMHKLFQPKSRCFLFLSVFYFCANGIFLGFHIASTCSMYFITGGSITFALYFCASLLETCAYVFDVTY